MGNKLFTRERLDAIKDCLVGDRSSLLLDLAEAESPNDVVVAFRRMSEVCDEVFTMYGGNDEN